jgi:hypothetical protein
MNEVKKAGFAVGLVGALTLLGLLIAWLAHAVSQRRLPLRSSAVPRRCTSSADDRDR